MLDPNARILIVDDFSTMRRIVRNTLKQLGYTNCEEAENGVVGLNKLQTESPYHLVVCDWNMPGMTGIDLLRAVRADPKLRHTPFLMVTAEGKRENVIEALQAGVNNYVIKPFNAETFSEKLNAIFKSRTVDANAQPRA